MTAPQSKQENAAPSLWITATRTPLLLLGFGLLIHGLLRWIAPEVSPDDWVNIIGLGAVLGAALVEFAVRKWKRKGVRNDAGIDA